MLNKIDNRQNNVAFGALKINQPFEKWNTDVLNATLNSRVIRNIIAKDAKDGKDTFLTFQQVNAGVGNKEMNMMSLNIKGAGKDLLFKAATTIEHIKTGIFNRKTEKVITGSKNLGQDIAGQIKAMDIETFSRKRAIQELEDVAGKIDVTEKSVGMDFEA